MGGCKATLCTINLGCLLVHGHAGECVCMTAPDLDKLIPISKVCSLCGDTGKIRGTDEEGDLECYCVIHVR